MVCQALIRGGRACDGAVCSYVKLWGGQGEDTLLVALSNSGELILRLGGSNDDLSQLELDFEGGMKSFTRELTCRKFRTVEGVPDHHIHWWVYVHKNLRCS